MRKVLVGVTGAAIVVAVLIVGAVGADFGASIYAEYRLSTTVRKAANLRSDPFVAILRFPFIPQAMREHYAELEIKAFAVEHAGSGTATLEATMHSIDLSYASWLIRPDAKLPVGELESRIIIDSMHLGRYLGISDLMVAAPRQESNDATGGTTESDIWQPRAGVQRHAHIGQLRSPGQRLGGPVRCLGRPRDLGYHPHRRRDRTRHRGPTGSG